jgi:hypothetical protein
MSGAVKSIGKKLFGGGGGAASNALVSKQDQATRQAAAEFQKSQGRSAIRRRKSYCASSP